MTDRITPEQRSRLMSRVKSKNSRPEMVIRRLIFAMGYRFRLHAPNLPGHPDIVFPSKRKVIFVHGCFWHRHAGCKRASTPSSRQEYWLPKFARTLERDTEAVQRLGAMGWSSLIIWECETQDAETLTNMIIQFLEGENEG